MTGPPSVKLALVLMALSVPLAAGTAGIALLTAQRPDQVASPARHRQHHRVAGRPPKPAASARSRAASREHPAHGGRRDGVVAWFGRQHDVVRVALVVALSTLLSLVGAVIVVAWAVRRRVRNRRRRRYGRYEIKLTAHDETKPEDLEEAVEAIAGIVRERADVRWKDGQPYFAIELHYGPTDSGMEWTACLVCEPRIVRQLDGALASAYPDVRVGHEFAEHPEPIRGALRTPVFVERFRKQRMFIYALGRDGRSVNANRVGGAPLMELVAQAQVASGQPSSVRLSFTPTVYGIERLAAGLMEWQENRSARQERWGITDAGLRSQYRQDELRNAQRTQNRSLFWFEILVASDDPAAGKAVCAAIQACRGENRLHRRRLNPRSRRARRRFVTGDPPLLPLCWLNWLAPPLSMVLALRTLMSSAEVARLVELPTARLKGVPVRRLMLPRIPAPPDAFRATNLEALTIPDDHAPFDETAFQPASRTEPEPATEVLSQ